MKHTHWVIAFILIALLGAMAGCYTENKARQQFAKAVIAYPSIPVTYCAEQFPDKADSVIVKTDTVTEVIINDPTLEIIDTAYFDTSNCKPITILKTKTITIRKDSIIYRENRAEQERLQLGLLACQTNNGVMLAKNTKLEQDLADWKKKAKTRWLWIALLIGGAATVAIFKVIKAVRPSV